MGGRKTAKSSGLHMRDCVRKDEENMKWKQERQPFISKHRKDCETAVWAKKGLVGFGWSKLLMY